MKCCESLILLITDKCLLIGSGTYYGEFVNLHYAGSYSCYLVIAVYPYVHNSPGATDHKRWPAGSTRYQAGRCQQHTHYIEACKLCSRFPFYACIGRKKISCTGHQYSHIEQIHQKQSWQAACRGATQSVTSYRY